MIKKGGCIVKTRLDIFRFQIGIIFQNFFLSGPRCKHFQYVFYTDAHTSDTGPATALRGIYGDSIHRIQSPNNSNRASFVIP